MRKGSLRERAAKVLTEESEAELTAFLKDLRDSFEHTNHMFAASMITVLVMLGTHYLAAQNPSGQLPLLGLVLPVTPTFLSFHLFAASLFFLSSTCVGYLRRYQGEVYDWLCVGRYKALGKTGLHELRLPPSVILGLRMLRDDEGRFERIVGKAVGTLFAFGSVVMPFAYILVSAVQDATRAYGVKDPIRVFISFTSIVAAWMAALIIGLSGRMDEK